MSHTDTQRTVGALQIVGGAAELIYGGGYGLGGGGGYLIGSGIQNVSAQKGGTYNKGTKGLLADFEGSLGLGGLNPNRSTYGMYGGAVGGLLGGLGGGGEGGYLGTGSLGEGDFSLLGGATGALGGNYGGGLLGGGSAGGGLTGLLGLGSGGGALSGLLKSATPQSGGSEMTPGGGGVAVPKSYPGSNAGYTPPGQQGGVSSLLQSPLTRMAMDRLMARQGYSKEQQGQPNWIANPNSGAPKPPPLPGMLRPQDLPQVPGAPVIPMPQAQG